MVTYKCGHAGGLRFAAELGIYMQADKMIEF